VEDRHVSFPLISGNRARIAVLNACMSNGSLIRNPSLITVEGPVILENIGFMQGS
jgi:hypothetical protein